LSDVDKPAPWRVRGEIVLDEFQAADNALEYVVEVVRHPSGEGADCLQLLGVPQHILDLLAVGNLRLQAGVVVRHFSTVLMLFGQIGQHPAQHGLIAVAAQVTE
jgi:hypothetical protein